MRDDDDGSRDTCEAFRLILPGAVGRRRSWRFDPIRRRDEAELIRLSQQGDDDAFTRLMEIHDEKLRRLCYLKVRVHDSSDDAFQETLIAIWKGIGGFRGRAGPQFEYWLDRVCLNAVANTYRRRFPEPIGDGLEMIESKGSSPEQIAEACVLRTLLDQLPDSYREALILRDECGYKLREIAKYQMCSVSTVKSRVRRARTAMYQFMKDDDV